MSSTTIGNFNVVKVPLAVSEKCPGNRAVHTEFLLTKVNKEKYLEMKLFRELSDRSNSNTSLEIFEPVLFPPAAARLLVMLLIFKAAIDLGKGDRVTAS